MNNGTESEKTSLQDRMQQLGMLAGFIVDFLATILSYEQVKYWLEHKTELKKKLREVFSIVDEYASIREEWQKFYKNHFGWDVDFSQVIIPAIPTNGKWRLLFISKGMTLNFAFKICEKLFVSSKYYDDLDKAISKNIRNTSSHYAVWVRDEVEPDAETLGKSTRQADPDMKIGITLLERIIFEIKYFTETGNHLDVKGVTFCSGSRDSDGDVPSTYLDDDGEFEVHCHFLDDSYSDYGIRSVVELDVIVGRRLPPE
ncbi:MAG: hypothetical protein WC264_01205 [Candidatus Paceibacterota bacterium]|jgi:hypothetical protein